MSVVQKGLPVLALALLTVLLAIVAYNSLNSSDGSLSPDDGLLALPEVSPGTPGEVVSVVTLEAPLDPLKLPAPAKPEHIFQVLYWYASAA